MFWGKDNKASITPLGGVDYVGHNCFIFQDNDSAVVVDCGIKPQTYDERKKSGNASGNWVTPPPRLDILDKILREKGSGSIIGVITHAHLDHIGAAVELARRKIPIHLSRWSESFLERADDSMKMPAEAELHIFNGQAVRHGSWEISFIPLQHSIPGTHGILLRTKEGKNILHLSDFKLNGVEDKIDETRKTFKEIKGRIGKIHCLLLDVLNVEMQGFTPPEQLAIDSIERIIERTEGRVIITFFSSNIRRMEGILNTAKAQGRVVSIAGWGMRNSYELLDRYLLYQDGDIFLIGGSQGEENSGLAQLAQGEHKCLTLTRRDTVVFSSRCIPGNEEGIELILEKIRRRGVRVILNLGETAKLNLSFAPEEDFLHVSGHGQRQDLAEAVEILKPDRVVPFHATPDRCRKFKELIGRNRTQILQPGETLEV